MKVSDFYNFFLKQNLNFTTDSRKISDGCIFFALKGEHFNGNNFAQQALDAGAAYVVVDEDVLPAEPRAIKVSNVLFFMQQLAYFHRKCFDIPVIAIAGSNGKTTTKNLLFEVLKSHFKTHCTQGNFNNHIGVPITLLQIPYDCEIAIVEIGTNSPGEVEALCKMVAPTYGIITNIGKEHLEGFGTLEAIAHEESQLFRFLLDNDGLAFVNNDDEMLNRMSKRLAKVQYYSKKDVEIHSLVPNISFDYENQTINANLMGDYNLDNILSAITIGNHFSVPTEKMIGAIENYIPSTNRSQIIHKGSNQIWLDAYNANPSSMEKAITAFSQLENYTKIALLGDMFELGTHALIEHENILELTNKLGIDEVYTVGNHFHKTNYSGCIKFKTVEALIDFLKNKNFNQTAFLIKGSRGVKMEKVLDCLT